MALRSLAGHMQTQHGREAEGRHIWEATNPSEQPCTYRMAFLTARRPRNCPVEGCTGRAAMRTAMQIHCFHRHVRDTVIILEEGNIPHPRYPQCNIMVPWSELNRSHLATTQ